MEILTVDELVALLKVSKRTICKLMGDRTNPLPVLKIGRCVRFRKSEIDLWLTRQAVSKAA